MCFVRLIHAWKYINLILFILFSHLGKGFIKFTISPLKLHNKWSKEWPWFLFWGSINGIYLLTSCSFEIMLKFIALAIYLSSRCITYLWLIKWVHDERLWLQSIHKDWLLELQFDIISLATAHFALDLSKLFDFG